MRKISPAEKISLTQKPTNCLNNLSTRCWWKWLGWFGLVLHLALLLLSFKTERRRMAAVLVGAYVSHLEIRVVIRCKRELFFPSSEIFLLLSPVEYIPTDN